MEPAGGEGMQMDLRVVACLLLPLALIYGCASQSCWTAGSWSDQTCDQTCEPGCEAQGGGCRVCQAPRWYWSHGRYIHWYDSWVTRRAAEKCAEKSFHNDPAVCSSASGDFYCGYRQAFIDLANGGSGVTPAVPPQKYWKAHNRSDRGYKKAEQWFEGYRAGVCAARGMGRQEFLYVPASAEAAQAENAVYHPGRYDGWNGPAMHADSWQTGGDYFSPEYATPVEVTPYAGPSANDWNN